jgi:hypothetical protein
MALKWGCIKVIKIIKIGIYTYFLMKSPRYLCKKQILMKRLFFILLFLLPALIHAQNIYTVAGSGYHPIPLIYSGDGGPATNAGMNHPHNVFVDSWGNIFIADRDNNVIRKVNTSGVISTIAGTGFAGFVGDGGPATAAQLNGAHGVVVDNSGNIFIVDINNYRIRKVNSAGIISTIAGNGVCCWSSDGGLADTTKIMAVDIALDNVGNVIFSDTYTNRVRKISMSTGVISTIAGTGILGFSGDGGPATLATLHSPTGIAIDDTGNIYIADNNNNRVRKINTSGIINTIAGSGLYAGFSGDGGRADTATLDHPRDIAIDSFGNIYITLLDHRIRKVNPLGFISTICGNGSSGFTGDGGPSTAAKVYYPKGVVCDNAGNVYFADEDNFRVRKIGSDPITLPTKLIASSEAQMISIYPNPANEEMHIAHITTNTAYMLYDVVGAAVQQGILPHTNNTISLRSLPPGMYLLHLTDEEGRRVVKKVVRE